MRRQAGQIRSSGKGHAAADGDGPPGEAGGEDEGGGFAGVHEQRQQAGQDQPRGAQHPCRRVRQELQRVAVGAVDRGEGRRAPHAGVDAPAGQGAHERQRAVDAAAPQHLAAHELLGMVGVEPGLAFAVADLLAPVALHRGAMVVPDERGRGKADGAARGLQPPAHVDVVAGPQVDRVEAVDRGQGLAPEGHVAARHVFGDAVVEQHVGRTARRARHALGHPRIVGRHHVGAARSGHGRMEERLHQIGQPVGIDPHVGVGVGHDLAGGVRQPHVARGRQAAVGDGDHAHAREAPPRWPRCRRASRRSRRWSRRAGRSGPAAP